MYLKVFINYELELYNNLKYLFIINYNYIKISNYHVYCIS